MFIVYVNNIILMSAIELIVFMLNVTIPSATTLSVIIIIIILV
jgi:hypothetical protein